MITHLTGISAPVHTRDTVETGTVLPRFGKLKPIPTPVHTRDTLSRVYPYPCHALTLHALGCQAPIPADFQHPFHTFFTLMHHMASLLDIREQDSGVLERNEAFATFWMIIGTIRQVPF